MSVRACLPGLSLPRSRLTSRGAGCACPTHTQTDAPKTPHPTNSTKSFWTQILGFSTDILEERLTNSGSWWETGGVRQRETRRNGEGTEGNSGLEQTARTTKPAEVTPRSTDPDRESPDRLISQCKEPEK